MELFTITSGPLFVNTYILWDKQSNEAAIIDPGQRNDMLPDFIQKNAFDYKYLIATHGHFDHTVDMAHIKEALPQIKTVIHKFDEAALYDDDKSLFSNYSHKKSKALRADIVVHGGERLAVGAQELEIIHTPGHTRGGICIVCENRLFTGDTLFHREIGRCDLGDGDYQAIQRSIKKLYELPGDYFVYPGHEAATTLDEERKFNPYVRQE